MGVHSGQPKNGALYIGVTADLISRIGQHRNGTGSIHASSYGIDRLVVIEHYPTMIEAIEREKALKKWRREWKIKLIQEQNPDWRDLFCDLNG